MIFSILGDLRSATVSRRHPKPLHLYLSVWRQRQVLRSLTADALQDIGVSRTQAEKEANRWFWDLRGISE